MRESPACPSLTQPLLACERSVMVLAYDKPLPWDGHASTVTECVAQLHAGMWPATVVCCVGIGGLAGGVMLGCACGVGRRPACRDGDARLVLLLSVVRAQRGRRDAAQHEV